MKKLPPNLVKRGDVYVYRVKVNGKTQRLNLHTRNFNEAMVKYREILANGHESFCDTEQTPGVSVATLDWQQLRDWDMARMRGEGSRPEVVESSLGCTWKRLRPYFPDAHAVSADSLEQFRLRQLGAGVSSATIKRDLYAIMRAYDWACDQLGTLPVLRRRRLKMKATPRRKAKGEFIEPELLAGIAARLEGPALYRLAICVTTGIRSGEWSRIRPSWLRHRRIDGAMAYFLDIPEGKAKTEAGRTLPLSHATWQMLRSFDGFGVNYRKAWCTAAKAEGLGRLSQRDLRHTFATTMGEHDKWTASIAMGHVDPADRVGAFYQTKVDKRLAKLAAQTLIEWPWVAEAGVTLGVTVPFDAKRKVPNS